LQFLIDVCFQISTHSLTIIFLIFDVIIGFVLCLRSQIVTKPLPGNVHYTCRVAGQVVVMTLTDAVDTASHIVCYILIKV